MKNKVIYLKNGLKAYVNNIGKNRWEGKINGFDGIVVEAKSFNELKEELSWTAENIVQEEEHE